MPYVRRDEDGRIIALLANAAEADESLPADHPEVIAFLSGSAADALSERTDGILSIAGDLRMVRVIEDLIEVLIEKRVINFTDLPQAARDKIMMRRQWREQLIGDNSPISYDDGIL